MFGKIIFVVIVNYDVIAIQAIRTPSLGKCGRTVCEIVLTTDDFEAIENGNQSILKMKCLTAPVFYIYAQNTV